MMAIKATEQEQRQAVLDEAALWLRTPYHHRAIIKGVGADCMTLLIACYGIVGLAPKIEAMPQYTYQYGLHDGDDVYLDHLLKYSREVPEPQPADVVVYKVARLWSHCGIVVKWPTIIHAQVGEGVRYAEGNKAPLAFQRNGKGRPIKFLSPWAEG